MKFFANNAVYVQKKYFYILPESSIVTKQAVPKQLLEFENKWMFKVLKDEDFIKITNREEMEFFKKADWIPEYNDYSTKDPTEVEKSIKITDAEIKEFNKWFETLDEQKQEHAYQYCSIRIKLLEYKKEALISIFKLRRKNLTPNYKLISLIKK